MKFSDLEEAFAPFSGREPCSFPFYSSPKPSLSPKLLVCIMVIFKEKNSECVVGC